MKRIKNMLVSILTEFNDSPKEFVKYLLIVAVALGVWGFVMGIMEEYR